VTFLAIAALALWLIIFLLPWRPWLAREKFEVGSLGVSVGLEEVTVLIPARNEEQVLRNTLDAVLQQGPGLSVTVINDQSTDNTAEILRDYASRISVIDSAPLPERWSGKIWALEQGRKQVKTPLIFLLDADIVIKQGVISGLRQFMKRNNKDLVSLMAEPPLGTFWERMLMPAFVYYFKLLYPFSLANSNSKYVAAAAGGCILIKTKVLDHIGGFTAIGTALIDDCQLARQVKNADFSTWLGLTHSIRSARPYRGLSEIWNMVARTAFTQLNHSMLLLLLCTAVMALAYFVPVMVLWGNQQTAILGGITLLMMHLTYLPVLSYYNRSWLWAPVMSLTAAMYLGMTWTSAFRYWNGERMRWRGRKLGIRE
jgi:hopene-associated glycosyltransferase HpnB